MNKYIKRLFDEWKQHKSIIIGCDFDDTIFPYREDFTNHEEVIKTLKEAVSTGAIIVIYTGSHKDRYEEIKNYCKKIQLPISAINENVITPFGDNRKIYANIYIDDRAGLREALYELSQATFMYRGYLEEERISKLGDVA